MEGMGVDAGLRSFEVPEPGQILDDRYELVSWVGEGAFGEVWKALDLRLGITVAAKLAKSGASTARFAEEVRLLAKLQHPGIVTLRD
jgi:eukaryotic-like serine/threonine-protein kinase